VTLKITCQSLGIFVGTAQEYIRTQSVSARFPSMAGLVEKLECCKVDLDGMFEVFGLLGAWHILFKCVNTSIKCIDVTYRYVQDIITKVKTTTVVLYASGHGLSTEDGTDLLVRDENDRIHLDPGPFERNNLCIETTAKGLINAGDNSTVVLLLIDCCRTPLDTAGPKSLSVTDRCLQFKIKTWFPQLILFYSTSEGLPAHGAAPALVEGTRSQAISQFTGILYMVLKEVLEGNQSEVLKGNPFENPELIRSPFANHFVSGIVAVQDRVKWASLDQVLQGVCSITQDVDAQVPEYRDNRVREAVTFKPLPFPTLPAHGAPPQVSPCSTKAAPAVAGGAGLRIKGSCKGKESCYSEEQDQAAGKSGGATSSRRVCQHSPRAHTKSSSKQAKVTFAMCIWPSIRYRAVYTTEHQL